MAIMADSENGVIGSPGQIDPGTYSYVLVGADYWSSRHAFFVPGNYIIGAGNYVDEYSPWPALFVGVGAAPVGNYSYGGLQINGTSGNRVSVDVRAFYGWPEVNGGPVAALVIGAEAHQGDLVAYYADLIVDSTQDADGNAVVGQDRAFVLLGESGGHGLLDFTESNFEVVSLYQAQVQIGGDWENNQFGYGRLVLDNSNMFIHSHRAGLSIGGAEHSTIDLYGTNTITVISEPIQEYVSEEWVDATIKVGDSDGYGRLGAYSRSNSILIEGQHAGLEIGINGSDSYGVVTVRYSDISIHATAGGNDWLWETPGAPTNNFAYINVGGRPWADNSDGGDMAGGTGVLQLGYGATVTLSADSDPAVSNFGSSSVNIGSNGGSGVVHLDWGSELTVDRVNVGNTVDERATQDSEFALLLVNYDATLNADEVIVGDSLGRNTAEHAYLYVDASDTNFNVGSVSVTNGGTLLGQSFWLNTDLTIESGGRLRVGDLVAGDLYSLADGYAHDVETKVDESFGYFGNYGSLLIDGTVVMQATASEGWWDGAKDIIYNEGQIDIGSNAVFEISITADSSFYVSDNLSVTDPAVSSGSHWGRVLVIEGNSNGLVNSLDSGASVFVNGVEGQLWQEQDNRVWAYFDIEAALIDREYWIEEDGLGNPVAVSLERPEGFANTIYSSPYNTLETIYLDAPVGTEISANGSDQLFIADVWNTGTHGLRIQSGGGNDLIYADSRYEDLTVDDNDVLDLSNLSGALTWDAATGSVSNGTWKTLFTGIERVIGGSGNDTYILSGRSGFSITDYLGDNTYQLQSGLSQPNKGNWSLSYSNQNGEYSQPDFYVQATANVSGMTIERRAIGSNVLLGTDTTDGVVVFGDSAGDDRFDFRSLTGSAYDLQYGNAGIAVLGMAGGGNDIVIGNGYTLVDFGWNSDLAAGEGITFDAASAAEDLYGQLEYTVNWAGGSVRLVDVDRVGGTKFSDTFIGSDRDEIFRDVGGNDTISGGFGTDVIDYRNAQQPYGSDVYIGVMLRDETLLYEQRDGTGTLISTYLQRSDVWGSAGSDSLFGIEIVRGSSGSDYFSAGSFKTYDELGYTTTFNAFEGRGGDDEIHGNGNTRVDFVDSLVAVRVDLAQGFSDARYEQDLNTQAYEDSLGRDRIQGVNAVRGSAFDDWIVGTDTNTYENFEGRAGDDLIDGGGGAWNEVRYGNDIGGVIVNLATGVAQDGWGGTDTLIDIQGVRGSDFFDVLIGSDRTRQEGFDGGKGSDLIFAGGGYDEVMFDFAESGVTVDLSSAKEDYLYDGVTYRGFFVLDGSGGKDFISGIEGIEGSDFDDTLTGDSGNNRIDGRKGSDHLDGGGGVDWVEYNNNQGGVFVSLEGGFAYTLVDRTQYFAGVPDGFATGDPFPDNPQERDTLVNFENIQGSEYDDVLIGDAGDNVIATNGGADYVVGGEGVDTLLVGFNQSDSWFYYDGTVPNRVILQAYNGHNDVVVVDGVERIQYKDGSVAELQVTNGNVIDLNGPGNDRIYEERGYSPFYFYGPNDVRPADPQSLADWNAQFTLDGGVQGVRFVIDTNGNANGVTLNLSERTWDNGQQIELWSSDLFSTLTRTITKQITAFDPAQMQQVSYDQEFKLALASTTIDGKSVKTIVLETKDGSAISGNAFTQVLRDLAIGYADRAAAGEVEHGITLAIEASMRGSNTSEWVEGEPDYNSSMFLSFENHPLTAAYAAYNGSFIEVSFKDAQGNPEEVIGTEDYWHAWQGDVDPKYLKVTVNGAVFDGAQDELYVAQSGPNLILYLPGYEIPTGASVSVNYDGPEGDDVYNVLQSWRGTDVEDFTISASTNAPRATQRVLSDAVIGNSDSMSYLPEDYVGIAPFGLENAFVNIIKIDGAMVTLETPGLYLERNPLFDENATEGYTSYKWATESVQLTATGLNLNGAGVGDQISLAAIVVDGVRMYGVKEGAYASNDPSGSNGETFYFTERTVAGEGLPIYRFANAGFTLTWGGTDFYGSDFDDEIMGGLGDDNLYGFGGDDYIVTGAGDDYVDGGAGVDTVELVGTPKDYFVALQSDGSTLVTYQGDDGHPFIVDSLILENVEYLRFSVNDGEYYLSEPVLNHGVLIKNGVLTKVAGDYSKSPNPSVWVNLSQAKADELGYTIIEGTNGEDSLYSIEGLSALFGYASNDKFYIGDHSSSSKTLVYGDGHNDFLSVKDIGSAVTVLLDSRSITDAQGQTVLYAGLERIQGTTGSDTVRLNDSDGVDNTTGENLRIDYVSYQSLGGSDTISINIGSFGGESSVANDFGVSYEWVTNGGVHLAFTSANVSIVQYSGGQDALTNIQSFTDSNQADIFDFSQQDSRYWSYVNLGGGDDVVIGSGNTTVSYSNHPTDDRNPDGVGLYVDLSVKYIDDQSREYFLVDAREISSWDRVSFGIDKLINVEAVYGSRFADTFVGDDQNNRFRGEEGDDQLIGGAGYDTASYRNAIHAVEVQMAAGLVKALDYDGPVAESEGVDTLREIERIQGTNFADLYDATGYGADGAENVGETWWNSFEGRGGDDVIIGNGNTEVAYFDASMGVLVDLVEGFSDARAFFDANFDSSAFDYESYEETLGRDQFSGIGNVVGSSFNDQFIGTDVDPNQYQFWKVSRFTERFEGKGGDDLIDGGTGGLNVVEYRWDPGAVSIDLSGTVKTATQYVGEISDGVIWGEDTLINIAEFRGSAYSDHWIGSDVGFSWFTGVDNIESFAGGDGSDWIDGRGGINEAGYWFDESGIHVDLTNLKQQSDGLYWAEVTDGFGNTDYLRNIQWIEGSDHSDWIVGDANDNYIDGRQGNDYIDGGAGSDTAEYNQVTNGVFVDLPNGKAYENYQINGIAADPYSATATGEFVDTLVSIENVIGSHGNDYFIGDGEDNTFDGLRGDDVFAGGGGTDTIILRGNQDEYTVTQVQENEYLIESTDGESSLKAFDVEVLAFADKTVSINAPAVRFNHQVDPITGQITATVGWTGAATAVSFEIQAPGATLLADSVTSALTAAGWFVEVQDNGGSGVTQVSVSALGDPLVGSGNQFTFVMQGTGKLETVDLSLVDFAMADSAGNSVDSPALISIGSVQVGANVVVTAIDPVVEGSQAQWVEVAVSLDSALDVDRSMVWNVAGGVNSPVDASDFAGGVLPSGVLNFAAGETQKVIRFQVAGDNLVERDETFEIVLTPDAGLDISGLGPITGTILNDDKAKVSVTGESVLLPEGDSGSTNYTFDIELDQAAFESNTVNWMVDLIDGEASLADFTGALSGSVTFAAGETSKQITIGVAGDVLKEGREDFQIKLSTLSSDILVDPSGGVLDVQIKDDDGYDLGGQVYFWGKGDPSKQYLMDGVDVGLTSVTGNTPQELYDSAVHLRNLKLNVADGVSQAEVWSDLTDISSVSFTAQVPTGAVFTTALSSNSWDVLESFDSTSGEYSFNATWRGAANTQTADQVKVGTFTFDTPELGSEVTFTVLSAAAGNDVGESRENASAIEMKVGYESQTVVTAPLDETDGAYSMSSLTEGGYQVMMDKEFDYYTINDSGIKQWSAEVKSVNALDAREALLIGMGKQVSAQAIIAADVNHDGKVNSLDARSILLMSVKNESKLESGMDWVFIDADADLSTVSRSSVKEGVNWQQGSSLLLEDDALHENLIAILTGDCNGSYKPEDDVLLLT